MALGTRRGHPPRCATRPGAFPPSLTIPGTQTSGPGRPPWHAPCAHRRSRSHAHSPGRTSGNRPADERKQAPKRGLRGGRFPTQRVDHQGGPGPFHPLTKRHPSNNLPWPVIPACAKLGFPTSSLRSRSVGMELGGEMVCLIPASKGKGASPIAHGRHTSAS